MVWSSWRSAVDLVLDDSVILVIALLAVAALWPSALWIALACVGAYLAVKVVIFRSHLRSPAVGPEMMVGQVATALTALSPEGQVKWKGEIWEASARTPVSAGSKVRVARVDSLTLFVEPVTDAHAAQQQRPRSRLLAFLRKDA